MSDALGKQAADGGGLLADRELVEVLLIGTESGYVCGCWDGETLHLESTGQVRQEFPSVTGGSAETAVQDLLAARALVYQMPAGSFLDVHSHHLDLGSQTVRNFLTEVQGHYDEVHLNGKPLTQPS